MDITEKRIVEVEREVLVKKVCDFCGKEIKENWFRVTTSHSDWGADSGDSVELKDACCPECVLKFATDYINEAYEYMYNTQEIEIEHKKWV